VKLGVLGGTFDPPHLGHLVLAEQARQQLALERVVWLPAGNPWRKAAQAVSAKEHRLAMVQRAIEGNPAFEVATLELERDGPTYSADTLAALGEAHPGAQLFFLLGADALEDLPHWHEPERLIALATLAVASRGGAGPPAEALDRLLPGLSSRFVWVEMPRLDISATDLRRRAAAGESLRYLTPDAVAVYIEEQELYREKS
jgi:nicotinate-nucleotide adenylyltransferase